MSTSALVGDGVTATFGVTAEGDDRPCKAGVWTERQAPAGNAVAMLIRMMRKLVMVGPLRWFDGPTRIRESATVH